MHVTTRFLKYVDQSGIKNLSLLKAQTIYEAFEQASYKGGFRKCVSAFLRYAHRHSLTEQDLSVLVPSVNRHIPVPTMYTSDEVEKIIAASSQSKSCGKRNKAIVLIEKLVLPRYTRNICLHCLRHTFAVHSFRKQDLAGVDMYAAEPFLSAYMGHTRIYGTETYLHMTAENSTDVIEKTTAYSDGLFPEVPQ